MPINYDNYPPNWKTEIRPRILLRANNCCEECGIENGSVVHSFKENGKTVWRFLRYPEWVELGEPKKVKVVLTIAHLDHDEENHDVKDERLKAMCQLCHLTYDAEEKKKRRTIKSKKPVKINDVISDLRILFELQDEDLSSRESGGKFFINKQKFERFTVIDMLLKYFEDKYIDGGYLSVGSMTLVWTTFEVIIGTPPTCQ